MTKPKGNALHDWSRTALFGIVAAYGCLASASVDAAAPVVVLLDGSEVAAPQLSLQAGKLTAPALAEPLALEEVRRIRVAPARSVQAANAAIVHLVGGGRVQAASVRIGDDDCTMTVDAGSIIQLKTSIDTLRGIELQPSQLPTDFARALAEPSSELDRLFLAVDKSVESVVGLIESLDDRQLTFEYEGQSRSQPRERLFGLVVAQSQASDEAPACLLKLIDGSSIGGELVEISAGTVKLKIGGHSAVVPWAAVSELVLKSPMLTFLSDLKPIEAEQQPLVTLPRPWQRDRSCLGQTLTLVARKFDKGIGTHARCMLTFELDGRQEEFAAVVGLDAETEGKGDCIASVLADGKQVWSQRVQGRLPAQEVKLPLRGVRRLTLLVEPGEGLDLADHLDWCDARLIRKTK